MEREYKKRKKRCRVAIRFPRRLFSLPPPPQMVDIYTRLGVSLSDQKRVYPLSIASFIFTINRERRARLCARQTYEAVYQFAANQIRERYPARERLYLFERCYILIFHCILSLGGSRRQLKSTRTDSLSIINIEEQHKRQFDSVTVISIFLHKLIN